MDLSWIVQGILRYNGGIMDASYSAKNPVAGITEARNNKCILIEALIDGRGNDGYVRMRLLYHPDTFGC